jgi:hypothetical protein
MVALETQRPPTSWIVRLFWSRDSRGLVAALIVLVIGCVAIKYIVESADNGRHL